MTLKEITNYSDIIVNASEKWQAEFTGLLERSMAHHLPVHIQKRSEKLGISYEKSHQLTWMDQWAAEGEMYVRAFVEILGLDDEMLETLLTGTFVIPGDSQERINGYEYPNFFLMGLGALDINTLEIMTKTAQMATGSSN